MVRKSSFNFSNFNDEKFVGNLNQLVLYGVRVLAALMVIVIFWSLVDVAYHLYNILFSGRPNLVFDIDSIFTLFGGFLAVLIAVEVFLNIIFYLKKDTIHVPLVLATALTAIARKVIILDYKVVPVEHMYATAALLIVVGVSYWLVVKKSD